MKTFPPLGFFLFTCISLSFGQFSPELSPYLHQEALNLTIESMTYTTNREFEKAFHKVTKAIAIDSNFREAYHQLYRLHTEYGIYRKTVFKEMEKGRRIFKEDDEIAYYLGELYKEVFNYEKAFLEFSHAIKIASTKENNSFLVQYYYLNRGNIHLRFNRYELAVKDYNEMLKINPESTSGLTNRGIAWYKLGEKEKACIDWAKAMTLGFADAREYHEKLCKKMNR